MALYHTYRPQAFKDIVGQSHIVKTLTNQLILGKTAHAYLFSGPRGVGKTTSARLLAKALNCEKRKPKESEPCNTCSACGETSESRSIDVIEIDAASHTGVDHVREHIIENAQFKPTKSPYKVFIIDEVHMLSGSAFNALLKTLEEPPSHVAFILATTEKHKLPDTIISRCQVFDFKKIPYDEMLAYLKDIAKKEKVKIDDDVLSRVINKSDGCARDAVSLLDQLFATGEKHITPETASLTLPSSNIDETLAFVRALIEKDAQSGLSQLQNLFSVGTDLYQFAHDTIELFRIMMIGKSNPALEGLGLDIQDTAKKELKKMGEQVSPAQLVELLDLLLARKKEIRSAPLPQLPLEMAIISWCAGKKESAETKSDTQQPAPTKNTDTTPRKKEVEKAEVKNSSVEKEVVEPKPTIASGNKVIKKEEVDAVWQQFTKTIESDSPSLVFIIKMSTIQDVVDTTITLGVQYGFHRDKLLEPQCRKKLEGVLSDLLNARVSIEATVQEVAQAAPKEDPSDIAELTAAFGGQAV